MRPVTLLSILALVVLLASAACYSVAYLLS